jgi:predicted alpha/beta superfamily hydrolase
MIHLVASVPSAHSWDAVYLAAADSRFGSWRARGVQFERHFDGTHHLDLDLPNHSTLEYLLTRGHWRAAELDASGRERLPRTLHVHSGHRETIHVSGWGRQSVHYHHHVQFPHDLQSRTLTVYTPPGYDLHPQRHYPVLYMHDGQNLFDAHTSFAGVPWRCDELAEEAIRRGEVEPILIVGIANTPDRIREYGPRRCGPARQDDLSRAYGQALVEYVKPFIESQYRVRPEPEFTGIGGSSLGGLISLHLCKWYPNVFGKCLAMSPSLWWQREYFLRNLRVAPRWLKSCKIWLDMGGYEGATRAGMKANLRRVQQLARQLQKQGLIDGQQFRYREDPNGGHNEAAWGHRFPEALQFLFPAHPGQGNTPI